VSGFISTSIFDFKSNITFSGWGIWAILSDGGFMDVLTPTPLKLAIEPYIPLGRSGLLPALHAAQKLYGWVSEPVAAEIAKALHVPLADVHGVIEF
jgi:hypothetical protein